jgi:hypothetical protein
MLGNVLSNPRITSLSSLVSVGEDAQPESVTVVEACATAGSAVFPWVVLAPTVAATSRLATTATNTRKRFIHILLR